MPLRTNTLEGIRIVDAKRPITIEVTAHDIRTANRKKPDSCAVAKACRRQLQSDVRVHLGRIYVRARNTWLRYLTPQSMRSEIVALDRGGTFEPGVWKLKPAHPAKRLGKAYGTSTNKTNPNRKRRPYHALTNVRPSPAA